MPDIIKVDTQDKLRTLLTDVLPYELPLWFTNFNMYLRFTNEAHYKAYEAISGLSFSNKSGVYIPLDYRISRGENRTPRTISIMHPAAQIQVCNFYQEYDDLIEYHANKSKFSLRHPYRKTTQFYGKSTDGSKIIDGVESSDEDRITSSSYFKYKKYPFLYRFFESYEYHKLEKQFNSMLQVDISKCFPSIYTHSLGWAVKNKRLAKEKPYGSFDSDFDGLMQLTNYRETNGIIIGPEVSRIFAEIILQKIDLNIVKILENKGITISKDYEFRRYVDDYFVFYKSDDIRKSFLKTLEFCLSEYKMYLNEAKTIISSRPFATGVSLAKHSLKNVVNNFYKSRYIQVDTDNVLISKLTRPDSKANKAISEIKMALASHKSEYSSISNYLFSAITKKTIIYISTTEEANEINESILNWLLVDLDLLFFIHAMDIRIRPTDRLGRLINDIIERTIKWPDNYKEIIYKKIFDHVKQAINIFIFHSNDLIGLETLNLLIILTMLPDSYKLHESKLEEYFTHLTNKSETNDFYFRWVTCMLYISNSTEYDSLRSKLIDIAEHYLLSSEDMFRSTEYFFLYFDYLSCPNIPKAKRDAMAVAIKNKTLTSQGDPLSINLNKYLPIVTNTDFIVSWRDKNYLKNSLQKKEFLFSYN